MDLLGDEARAGILEARQAAVRDALVAMLTEAYWKEIETLMNYVANSINPDGIRAETVKQVLAADAAEELAHARLLGERIKQLYGVVPGSKEFVATQASLQPPSPSTNLVSLLHGVIEAEDEAIALYERIIDVAADVDPVTEDMVVGILRDEQAHRRLFEGFLKEYEGQGIGLA